MTNEQLLINASKRNKKNDVFYNNVYNPDSSRPSKYRGLLVLNEAIPEHLKINTVKKLILFLSLAWGSKSNSESGVKFGLFAKELGMGLDDVKATYTPYLSSVGTDYVYVNPETNTVSKKRQTNNGRLRSFDDVVAIVGSYFPTVHYLKIYEAYMTTCFVDFRKKGNSIMETTAYPYHYHCSGMARIRANYGTNQSPKNCNPTDSPEVVIREVKAAISQAKQSTRRNCTDIYSSNKYSSVYSWSELKAQYQKMSGKAISAVPVTVLSFKDMYKKSAKSKSE